MSYESGIIKFISLAILIYSIYVMFILSKNLYFDFKKLKLLQDFYINTYSYDLKQRNLVINDLLKLSFGFFVMLLVMLTITESFTLNVILSDENLGLLYLFYFGLFISYIVKICYSKISPLLLILSSTVFGFIIIVTLLLTLLMLLIFSVSLIANTIENGLEFQANGFYQIFVENFIKLGLGLIYIASDKMYFISNLLLSSLIQVLIIFIIPPYFFYRLKSSLTFINYIFNALILLLLFMSQDISITLDVLIKNLNMEDYQEFSKIARGSTPKEVFDKFINVSLIPYIIGSFAGLIFLEFRERKLLKEAKDNYIKALQHLNNSQIKVAVKHFKKAVFYGGEQYELLIMSKQEFSELKSFLFADIALRTSLKERIFNKIREKVIRIIDQIKEYIFFFIKELSKVPLILKSIAFQYNITNNLIYNISSFSVFLIINQISYIPMNMHLNLIVLFIQIMTTMTFIVFFNLFSISTMSFFYFCCRLILKRRVVFIISIVFLLALVIDFLLISKLINIFFMTIKLRSSI
ncbi:hypothetical protein BK129_24195 [Paenibacillus amylolyticus]|nr:hypothetical protein BK129_24195 [Paenibacillus amylolyticus]